MFEEKSSYKIWFWLIPLTLFWPVLNLVVFWVRFGNTNNGIIGESLVFAPMGLVAGIVLLILIQMAQSAKIRSWILGGYLIAVPVAFFGALMSGLILQPLLGTLLCGGLPLIAGSAGAYWYANRE